MEEGLGAARARCAAQAERLAAQEARADAAEVALRELAGQLAEARAAADAQAAAHAEQASDAPGMLIFCLPPCTGIVACTLLCP